MSNSGKSYKKTSNQKNKPNNKNEKKVKQENKDNTTRIRIDEKRLNDTKSLDKSFLEEEYNKKSKAKKISKKEQKYRERRKKLFYLEIVKDIFYILGTICIVTLMVSIYNNNIKHPQEKAKSKETKVVQESKKVEELDDNFLFVGDFHTDRFDFGKWNLDYHYVKYSYQNNKTEDMLNHMKERIYDYNPSILFLELGIKDLENISEEQLLSNIETIIKNTQINRPYAKIYVETLYPINKDMEGYEEDIISESITNDQIKDINQELKKLCNKNQVNYMDIYTALEEDDHLNEQYTENGVYLNEEGYKIIYDMIQDIVG